MKRRTSHRPLAVINRNLSRAAQLLDAAAADIRDVNLEPSENIRKIGSALVTIFEIQHQIYRQQPSLAPAYLKKARGAASAEHRNTRKQKSRRQFPSGKLQATRRPRS